MTWDQLSADQQNAYMAANGAMTWDEARLMYEGGNQAIPAPAPQGPSIADQVNALPVAEVAAASAPMPYVGPGADLSGTPMPPPPPGQTSFGGVQGGQPVSTLGPVPLDAGVPPAGGGAPPLGGIMGQAGAAQGGGGVPSVSAPPQPGAASPAPSYSSAGATTGGGSGSSSGSTGQNAPYGTVTSQPQGNQQSQWSQILHQSGALQDPRNNPIPFDQYPGANGMFDPYMQNTSAPPPQQGGMPQLGSMPSGGGVGSLPSSGPVQPGGPMPPSMPVQQPPLPGGGSQPMPGSMGPAPQPGAMSPEQQQLMAAQMNMQMRKRYGGY